tara:strand:+ start:241 stop:597 length:357 start_codon:yes stop_codon:yes gene_type:complete
MEMPEFVGRPASELLAPAKADINLLDDALVKMEELQVFLSDWSDVFKSNEIQYYNAGVQFIQDAIKYAMTQAKITKKDEWGSFANELLQVQHHVNEAQKVSSQTVASVGLYPKWTRRR